MSNMGYCKYRNTLGDLQDCYDEMTDTFDLSSEEAKARRRLIDLCKDIVDEFGDEEE